MYCEKEELREMNRSDLSEEEISELFMREAESQVNNWTLFLSHLPSILPTLCIYTL